MSQRCLRFAKMHGIGNDFVVINNLNQQIETSQLAIASLADRHTGVGFDQLLMIEPSPQADFFCRIFNADGSEAEQCGNGLRCVARYVHENQLIEANSFSIETKAGIFPVEIHDYDQIRVKMGVPHIIESLKTVNASQDAQGIPPAFDISVLSMGNPHAVLKVDSLGEVNALKLAPVIASQSYFPHGVNIGFMEILQQDHIRLRTFERGSGETLACGSNACAAAVAGMINGWLASSVQVEFKRGSLRVEWEGGNRSVYLTGPAALVFMGELFSAG